MRIVQEQQAHGSSGRSERVLSQDDFHNSSHLAQQTLSSKSALLAAPPALPAVGDDIICAVVALKISCFAQSEQLLMHLQVLGMVDYWFTAGVLLGNHLVAIRFSTFRWFRVRF